jgi:nucleoside 2-deoxyribosyltransferase
MLLYIAGPDVFRPDALGWAESARKLCRQHGYEALTALDSGETEWPAQVSLLTFNVGLDGARV